MIASTPTPSEARPGRRAPKAYQVHRPDPETSPAHQRGRRSPPCSPLRLPHDLPVSERVLATLEHELRLTGKYFREKVHAVLLDLVPSHLQSELGAVLKYASKDGTFEKSYAAMIDPALRRRRTLVRNFAYLDGIGAVEIQRHPLPNGDNRPNTFQLRWPRCLRPHVERVERGGECLEGGCGPGLDTGEAMRRAQDHAAIAGLTERAQRRAEWRGN